MSRWIDQTSEEYPPCGMVPMSPRARRSVLLREVDVVIDGGANAGQYANWLRSLGYAGRIVSFEPVKATFAQLMKRAAVDPAWECHNVALGAVDGESTINVARDPTGSSFYSPEAVHLHVSPDNACDHLERIRVRSLESLWPAIVRRDERVYLKLDVEGSEFAILQATDRLEAHVAYVEVELHVTPMYRGIPLLPEVMFLLLQRGFTLMGLEHNGGDESDAGQMLMMDGIFRNPRV